MSVQLTPDTPEADLLLSERSAWVNTAFGWLQPYVDDPLPGSAARVQELVEAARSTTDAAQRGTALLAEVQAQAAADLTVLPSGEPDAPSTRRRHPAGLPVRSGL